MVQTQLQKNQKSDQTTEKDLPNQDKNGLKTGPAVDSEKSLEKLDLNTGEPEKSGSMPLLGRGPPDAAQLGPGMSPDAEFEGRARKMGKIASMTNPEAVRFLDFLVDDDVQQMTDLQKEWKCFVFQLITSKRVAEKIDEEED